MPKTTKRKARSAKTAGKRGKHRPPGVDPVSRELSTDEMQRRQRIRDRLKGQRSRGTSAFALPPEVKKRAENTLRSASAEAVRSAWIERMGADVRTLNYLPVVKRIEAAIKSGDPKVQVAAWIEGARWLHRPQQHPGGKVTTMGKVAVGVVLDAMARLARPLASIVRRAGFDATPLRRLTRAPKAHPPEAWDDVADLLSDSLAATAERSAPPRGGAKALTADHESILAVLRDTPMRCRTVVDVSGAGQIRNRETVGRLLRELTALGMVHRPHGARKGYALTEAARAPMGGASPTQVGR